MSEESKNAVFVASETIEGRKIKGPDFDKGVNLESLIDSYASMGFQASSVSRAIDIINKMRSWRGKDEEGNEQKCRVFLGFTSNLVSSGMREVIRFLVEHKYVDCMVTTAGGIEEDIIKCLGDTYMTPNGRFDVDGATLRRKGINRIGNLLVPNNNYCEFEDWVMPLFDKMVEEQETENITWTPSAVTRRLGLEINNKESILYWAAKNDIPVFCPALTDGSLGDMMYFHSYKTEKPFVVDLVGDIRKLNDMAVKSPKAGIIILGGGVCKHQICNSMLFRNGADYAVYINTGQEYDGSDSGARPDEAVSWGKLKIECESVKVYSEVTLVFPLIVAATWAREHPK